MINYRQATKADVDELVPNLRSNDVEELLLSCGPKYSEALLTSVDVCEGRAEAAIDPAGNVIAILGCSKFKGKEGTGIPFMVCSDEVNKYPKHVIRDAKERTRKWNAKYPMLINMVYAGNTKTIKWLEHIGYTIGKRDDSFGYAKASFYAFYRIKNNV